MPRRRLPLLNLHLGTEAVVVLDRKTAERGEVRASEPCPSDELAKSGKDAEHAGEQHATAGCC